MRAKSSQTRPAAKAAIALRLSGYRSQYVQITAVGASVTLEPTHASHGRGYQPMRRVRPGITPSHAIGTLAVGVGTASSTAHAATASSANAVRSEPHAHGAACDTLVTSRCWKAIDQSPAARLWSSRRSHSAAPARASRAYLRSAGTTFVQYSMPHVEEHLAGVVDWLRRCREHRVGCRDHRGRVRATGRRRRTNELTHAARSSSSGSGGGKRSRAGGGGGGRRGCRQRAPAGACGRSDGATVVRRRYLNATMTAGRIGVVCGSAAPAEIQSPAATAPRGRPGLPPRICRAPDVPTRVGLLRRPSRAQNRSYSRIAGKCTVCRT